MRVFPFLFCFLGITERQQLHTSYKEKIYNVLGDLQKEIQKENDLLKKLNKQEKEEFNTKATIEKLTSKTNKPENNKKAEERANNKAH